MHYRKELVEAINEVLAQFHEVHDEAGEALDALDALGFTVGLIFSCAPDLAAREVGREHLVAAIEAGLVGQKNTLH